MTARYAIIEQRFLITIYKIRSQPNCFEVVVVVVILNVDVVDQATSKIDLMLLVMEVTIVFFQIMYSYQIQLQLS